MEKREVRVGIAESAVVFSPDKIVTLGLGSCIGIALYDRERKVAGLVHIMLPDSTQFRNITNPLKYADLGIEELLKKMINVGCKKNQIVAKIAGGAAMFKFSDKKINSDVGQRNALAVIEKIKSLSIPLISEDIGGSKGRSMTIESEDGTVIINVIGSEVKRI